MASTNTEQVRVCTGNHPDGPEKATTHFHKGGPDVCPTHYARMRRAELEAKEGKKNIEEAVKKALTEPAPTHKEETAPQPLARFNVLNVGGLNLPEHVAIWIRTAAAFRQMEPEALLIEIATEYYNQTCPDYLKAKVAPQETAH